MADGIVQVPADSVGKKIDTSELTVGGNTVERQRVVVSDPADPLALGGVANAQPPTPDSVYGAFTRELREENAYTQELLTSLVLAIQRLMAPYGSGTNMSLTVTIPNTSTVQATLTNNNAAPTTTNMGALVGIANAAAPAWTEGRQVLLSTDLSGAVRAVKRASAAAPGTTLSRIKAAATTNATNLKASAGNLYGFALYNNTAAAKFVKFYDKATAPTVGTDTPKFTVAVAPNTTQGVPVRFDPPIPFGTGVSYAITGAIADADTTATAVDDVHGFVDWM